MERRDRVRRRPDARLRFASRPGLLVPLLLVLFAWPGLAAGRHPPVEARQACVTPSCHAPSGAVPDAVVSRHDPFSRGECRSCHDLALPAEARFVRGAPAGPGEGPESARAWDLGLCLGCHGEELSAANAPAGVTGFSDGKRNLHALHVQAGRGRRCLPCHDPHGARQPRLLRERIPTRGGGARIAQEFRGAPNGGWCKTGCHAPKRYAR